MASKTSSPSPDAGIIEEHADDNETDVFDKIKIPGVDVNDSMKKPGKLRILIIGACGVGKSTFLNGLVGTELCKISEDTGGLQSVKYEIEEISVTKDEIDIFVLDIPSQALRDEKEVLERIKAKDPEDPGIDLILYCIRMDTIDADIDMEKKIMATLMNGLGVLKRSKDGSDIKKDIWKRCLFVLTYANGYQKSLDQDEQKKVTKAFNKKVAEWRSFFKEALKRCGVHVQVRVCTAGYKSRSVGDSSHWLSDCWATAFEIMKSESVHGAVALLRLNKHRIVESDSATADLKSPEEQPIVLTNKVKNVFGIASIGAAGVAGAATGATIGALIGAFAIGVISFGPAAGAGLAIGGVIGGAIGAAAASGVVKAFQHHKEKKSNANEDN